MKILQELTEEEFGTFHRMAWMLPVKLRKAIDKETKRRWGKWTPLSLDLGRLSRGEVLFAKGIDVRRLLEDL